MQIRGFLRHRVDARLLLPLLQTLKSAKVVPNSPNIGLVRSKMKIKIGYGALDATRSLLVLFTGGTFLRWIWWIFCLGETARISDFLPRHISPTKIRHFGEALFGGEFCTGVQYFTLGSIQRRRS